jgi:hypothetical protein
VSYAHDSEQHKADVRAFAEFLLNNGIDVTIDQWSQFQRRDWSSWATKAIKEADFIIVVASPGYRDAGDGIGLPSMNRGVQSEAAILRNLLHGNRETWLHKILPVLLPGHGADELPEFMLPYSASHYAVDKLTVDGADSLIRVITGQPGYIRPPRGQVPSLPPHPPAYTAVRDRPSPALPVNARQNHRTHPASSTPIHTSTPLKRPGGRRRILGRWVLTFALLAIVAIGVQQVAVRAGSLLDTLGFPRFQSAHQITQQAIGPPPWTVEGYGYRYTVESVVRTSHREHFQPKPSITITGFVTITEANQFSAMEFSFHDQGGNALDGVPFEGSGSGNPPLNQRAKLVSVIWDADPQASFLTITIHDFYWPAGRDLILADIPVT